MAGLHASASTSQLKARQSHRSSTPPVPPIRHSSSQHTLRHANPSTAYPEPPSTPPNRIGSARAKEAARSRQASHYRKEERQRAQTAGGTRSDPRHSHGLSWSSTTRDSLVDNLLTSLDGLSQLATRNYYDDDTTSITRSPEQDLDWTTRFDALNAMTNNMPRSRGHTYSSSMSSDRQVPDSPASYTSPPQKSRRSISNASGGIFNHKVRSSRSNTNEKVLLSDKDILARSKTSATKESSHARGWSDASSADQQFVEALEAPRLGFGGPRSMSVDNIRPMSASQDSMLNRGRPVPSVYSAYEPTFDAAPEPMVPAGPRKLQNPGAIGPVYVNAAPKQSALRKITTQSDLRAATSSGVPADVREKASEFVRSNGMLDSANRSAPGPVTQTRRDGNAQQDKPGFFKRVFGGSSNDKKTQQVSSERLDTSHGNTDPAPLTKQDRQVSADQSVTSSNAAPPPPTLNKKASFFRRRKKSTSEVERPPVPPLSIDRQAAGDGSRTSVSSLRKVMDPFLNEDPMKAAPKTDFSRPTTRASIVSDDLDIFHSGYTPPVVDVARTQSSKSLTGLQSIRNVETDSPKLKLRMRKRMGDGPPTTATTQSSVSSVAVDMALLNQSSLSYINTSNAATSEEPPKVSPLLEQTPIVNDDRRVSALGPMEQSTTPEASQEMRDFAAGNNVDLNMDSESWLYTRNKPALGQAALGAPQRLVLQPSDEKLPEAPRASSIPTVSSQPISRVESHSTVPPTSSAGPEMPVDTDSSAEYRERAQRIYDGNETDVSKAEASSWLGESKELNTRTLQEYMHMYDFAQMNILTALRKLCNRLVLRGETQQFDRIITALSSRWCECNPNHGFKAQDVVHTICYSLILLNTDLHLADIGEKMSKSAYVKNTLPTIRRVVTDAAPNAFDETIKINTLTTRPSIPWSENSAPSTPLLPPDTPQEKTSFEASRTGTMKSTVRPSTTRTESDGWADTTASNALVSFPSLGSVRAWESELELILKSFFSSIRNEPLPLLSLAEPMPVERNLSVNNLGLKRTGSIVSKAPSETVSSRTRGLRSLTLGFQSRNNRSRQKVFSTNTMSSSRTSFDDGNSLWSPAQSSSTWSKTSAGKALTSNSVNSLATSYMGTDREFKHSIGFANALSHAIIREEGGGIVNADTDSLIIRGDLLEDESLTLEGAPWAKEGMVKHKHHLEGPERKSKERSWNECFAVISRGKLTLFNFNTESKTRSLGRPRTKQGSQAPSLAGARVGGGDWMDNAEQIGVFILRHTISSTLPPPGYSKARPFVWALSLPSGAVHLFQVGTPEIAEEWMTTANYWSARLSKEPLAGGVSNIEYGWSDSVVNSAVIEKSESFSSPPPSIANRSQAHGRTPSAGTATRQSIQSSIRGSFDVGSSRVRLPGDKVHITEWSPPSQSIMASQLPEADQLRSLTNYVANVEYELETHHELKHAIELAFSPRHSNYNKAMTNWQRKSEYLLREVVKFRTYIDSLVAAQKSRDDVYTRRAERAQSRTGPSSTLSARQAAPELHRRGSNVTVSTVSLHAGEI